MIGISINQTQVCSSTPYDNVDTQLAALSAQETLDDLSFMQRDYLVIRTRDYFVPINHQYKIFNFLTLDGNLIIDGSSIVFT